MGFAWYNGIVNCYIKIMGDEKMKKIILTACIAVLAAFSPMGSGAFAAQDISTYSQSCNVSDFGAKGSDKLDDSGAFQQALDSCRNSDSVTTVNVPAGTYYLGSELRIYSNTYLKLSPKAKLIRTNDENYFFINGSDSDNNAGGYTRSHDITIDGGVWDGNVTNTKITNGLVKIWHAKNIKLINTTFQNCCGTHFIILDGVSDITVNNTKFSDFKEFTGTAESYKEQTGADFTYRCTEALHIDYIPKGKADSLPGDGTPCKNVSVTNCTFTRCTTGVGTHHVYEYMRANNVNISNNTFNDCYFYCIDAAGFTNFKAYGNKANNTGGLIFAERTSGAVYNNTLTSRTNLSGSIFARDNYNGNSERFLNAVRVSDKSNLEIYNNTLKNSTGNGIYVLENSSFTIKDNAISNAKMNGIMVYDGAKGKIYRNSINTTKLNGISIRKNSTLNELGRNTIKNASENGIFVTDSNIVSSRYNTISTMKKNGYYLSNSKASCDNNDISGCKEQGFYVASGANLTAYSNYVHGNTKCAFMVTKGATGKITNNNILKNGSLDLYVSANSRGIVFKNNGSDKNKTKVEGGCSASISGTKKCLKAYNFSIASSRAYTGKQIKLAVTSKLKKNTDYTVSYGKNVSTGEGTVKITGKGKYTGSFTLRFNIVPKKESLSSVSAISKGFTAKWKADSQATGYQIGYSTDSKFSKSSKVSVSDKNKTSATVNNLTKGKKYYVRMRAYKNINGKNYYGAWSAVKSVTAK